MTNDKIVKQTFSNIFMNLSFNSLANEYFAFNALNPGDKIPLDKFCADLNFKSNPNELDIVGSYITENKCLSNLSHDHALYDLFSMVFESALIDEFQNAPTTEQSFIIFPPDIQQYIDYIFPIFKSIILNSLSLPFYETLTCKAKHKPNSLKKCARIILHNKKLRTTQNFLYFYFSQYHFINKDYGNRFHAQLQIMKKSNLF